MLVNVGGGSVGHPVAAERIRSVVVYDAKSGRIIHTHHAVTMPGGHVLSDADLKDRAITLARQAMTRTRRAIPGGLEAMGVDHKALAPGFEYRVDIERRELVSKKIPILGAAPRKAGAAPKRSAAKKKPAAKRTKKPAAKQAKKPVAKRAKRPAAKRAKKRAKR